MEFIIQRSEALVGTVRIYWPGSMLPRHIVILVPVPDPHGSGVYGSENRFRDARLCKVQRVTSGLELVPSEPKAHTLCRAFSRYIKPPHRQTFGVTTTGSRL